MGIRDEATGISKLESGDVLVAKKLNAEYTPPQTSAGPTTNGSIDAWLKFVATYAINPYNIFEGFNFTGETVTTGQVKYDATDTAGYLGLKLTEGDGVSFTVSSGSNKAITISLDISESTSTAQSLLKNSTTLKKLASTSGITIASDTEELTITLDTVYLDTQYKYTAGSGIDITNNVITNTGSLPEGYDGLTNGTFIDLVSITWVKDGANWYTEIEKENGGNPRFVLDSESYTLDCTTNTGTNGKARSNMLSFGATAGDLSSNVLFGQLDGSNIPYFSAIIGDQAFLETGASAGILTLPTQTIFEASDFYSYQRFNNVVNNGVDDGSLHYQNSKARSVGVTYAFGVGTALNIDTGLTPDSMQLSSSVGLLFQMHSQLFSPTNGTQGYYIINHPTEPFKFITNLNELDTYSDGTPIADNQRFKFQVYGSLQSEDAEDKIFISMPSGGYTSDNSAINDVEKQNTNIQTELRQTSFRMCECVVRYDTNNGGEWQNLLGGTTTTSMLGVGFGATGGGVSSATPVIDIDQVKTVGKGGIVQYLDHASAIASITDASTTKPYDIFTYVGVYSLTNTLQTGDFISFKGANAIEDTTISHTDNLLEINNTNGNGSIDNMKFVMTPTTDNKINVRSVSTSSEDFVIKDCVFENYLNGDLSSRMLSIEGNSKLKILNSKFNYIQTGSTNSFRPHKLIDVNISNQGSVLINGCEFNLYYEDVDDSFTIISNTGTGSVDISNCVFNISIPNITRNTNAVTTIIEFLSNTSIKVLGDCTINLLDSSTGNHIVTAVDIVSGSGEFVINNVIMNVKADNNTNIAFLDTTNGGIAKLSNVSAYGVDILFDRGLNHEGQHIFNDFNIDNNLKVDGTGSFTNDIEVGTSGKITTLVDDGVVKSTRLDIRANDIDDTKHYLVSYATDHPTQPSEFSFKNNEIGGNISFYGDLGIRSFEIDGSRNKSYSMLDMNTQKVYNSVAGTTSGDLIEFDQFNTSLTAYRLLTNGNFDVNIDLNSNDIIDGGSATFSSTGSFGNTINSLKFLGTDMTPIDYNGLIIGKNRNYVGSGDLTGDSANIQFRNSDLDGNEYTNYFGVYSTDTGGFGRRGSGFKWKLRNPATTLVDVMDLTTDRLLLNVDIDCNTVTQNGTTLDNTYEPLISKNTAFNKNFGTTSGTVAEGDHIHTELDSIYLKRDSISTHTSGKDGLTGYSITKNNNITLTTDATNGDYITFAKAGYYRVVFSNEMYVDTNIVGSGNIFAERIGVSELITARSLSDIATRSSMYAEDVVYFDIGDELRTFVGYNYASTGDYRPNNLMLSVVEV